MVHCASRGLSRQLASLSAFHCRDCLHLPDTKLTPMRRALAAGVAAFPIAAAALAEDASGVASSRMSYSRFLEYLDMGRVKKVSLLSPANRSSHTEAQELLQESACMCRPGAELEGSAADGRCCRAKA